MARPTRETANCGVELMGFDFYATIDFTFTPGSKDYWDRSLGGWLPGDAPETEIHAITLQLDEPGNLGPKWNLDGALFDCVAELPRVQEAITTFDWRQ